MGVGLVDHGEDVGLVAVVAEILGQVVMVGLAMVMAETDNELVEGIVVCFFDGGGEGKVGGEEVGGGGVLFEPEEEGGCGGGWEGVVEASGLIPDDLSLSIFASGRCSTSPQNGGEKDIVSYNSLAISPDLRSSAKRNGVNAFTGSP